jgi:hypothetical protein
MTLQQGFALKIRKKPEKSPIFFKIYPLLKNIKLNYSSTPPSAGRGLPCTITVRGLLEMLKRVDY